jgi:hypothetical protein
MSFSEYKRDLVIQFVINLFEHSFVESLDGIPLNHLVSRMVGISRDDVRDIMIANESFAPFINMIFHHKSYNPRNPIIHNAKVESISYLESIQKLLNDHNVDFDAVVESVRTELTEQRPDEQSDIEDDKKMPAKMVAESPLKLTRDRKGKNKKNYQVDDSPVSDEDFYPDDESESEDEERKAKKARSMPVKNANDSEIKFEYGDINITLDKPMEYGDPIPEVLVEEASKRKISLLDLAFWRTGSNENSLIIKWNIKCYELVKRALELEKDNRSLEKTHLDFMRAQTNLWKIENPSDKDKAKKKALSLEANGFKKSRAYKKYIG